MSSAAVQQSTPQQYQSTQAGREKYAPPTLSSASPPTSRRTGRQGGGNGSLPNTPQQAQYASPTGSNTMTTPRGQAAANASPSEPMSRSTYQQFYPEAANSGAAAALPVRTSSQHAQTSAATSPYETRAYTSRPSQQQSGGYGSESDRAGASDNERRQQRNTQRSPRDETPGSAGRGQRSRNAPTQSRSATAVGQAPVDTSLPRENSAIINHIVVDDPQSDLARERARVAEARPHQPGMEPAMIDPATPSGTDTEQRHRSRQEHLRQSTSARKEVKFGDYILGQTLGEGEFGKVKMGWKKDSTVQVAIKLIRKESLQSNASRLPKIYREISILKELQHPNIVRLHEFVETERHMGIILEYASGGELFDYILNHRYLKDPAARRLFAQLVSGVGYLHKKGIVHRDLKLENLLLDRNRNIIITDFGFANTFDPDDELGEEVEDRIGDKEFVKREGLGEPDTKTGFRRGDLMQTSCGSPCYAAPELVVSDGLYTGRKVDVWSCGVILYAMLAGYLPFDDDPANPEGDNINLLYKYIVSTPLTFPEYVTPHARDLLRRILVPDPRKRADLFEVARHSWLSEYSHVVGFIGCSTKSDRDIATSALRQEEDALLARSASVREPASRSPAAMSAGGYTAKPHVNVADAAETDVRNKQRDAKRRTVQVEYVAPKASTARGETSPTAVSAAAAAPAVVSGGRTRARGDSQGPVEVPPRREQPMIPRKEVATSGAMAPPVRPARDQIRAASDSTAFTSQPTAPVSRPTTSNTLGSARLPSRGNSYSQPAMATPTPTNAQGHFSQPKSGSSYMMSTPAQADRSDDFAQYQQQPRPQEQQASGRRSHKRSSTLGSLSDRLLGRSNSRRASQQSQQDFPAAAATPNEKRDRKYPPVSMRNAIPANTGDDAAAAPRPSTESSRRPSFGFGRKASDVASESTQQKRSSRRFSFLPSSSSMNIFGGRKESSTSGYENNVSDPPSSASNKRNSSYRPESKGMAFGQGRSTSPSRSTTNGTQPLYYDSDRDAAVARQQQQQVHGYGKTLPAYPSPPPVARKQYRDDGFGGNLLDGRQQAEPVERFYTPSETLDQVASQPQASQSQQRYGSQPRYANDIYNADGYGSIPGSRGQQGDVYAPSSSSSVAGPNANADVARTQQNIRPPQRKFANEYDHGYGGSSGATRRVMDFFRRRGKDRSES